MCLECLRERPGEWSEAEWVGSNGGKTASDSICKRSLAPVWGKTVSRFGELFMTLVSLTTNGQSVSLVQFQRKTSDWLG